MIKPTPEEEERLEKTKAPLLDHLIELRGRLIKSVVAFFAAFILCYFFAQPIYAFLVQPLYDAVGHAADRRMIFTSAARDLLHLCEARHVRRTVPRVPVYGGAIVDVRGARSLQARTARVSAVPRGDAVHVHRSARRSFIT